MDTKKGKGKGEWRPKEKGASGGAYSERTTFYPPPDYGDSLVKVRNQMEVSRLKADRKIATDASKNNFLAMRRMMIEDKTGRKMGDNPRAIDEAAKKAFILYIQSWIGRTIIEGKIEITKEDT